MRTPLLVLSLATNVALALFIGLREPRTATPGMPMVATAEGRAGQSTKVAYPGSPGSVDLIAQLRDAGFPPSMMRAAAIARVNEKFAGRIRDVFSLDGEVPPFWETNASVQAFHSDPARRRARLLLEMEMEAELRRILGPDKLLPVTPREEIAYRRKYGNLPLEKALRVEAINAEYDFQRNEVIGYGRGFNSTVTPNANDFPKLASLELSRRAELERALTPDEFEGYRVRNSPGTRNLPAQLALLEPTEAEYLAIAKLRLAFDDAFGTNDPYSTSTEQSKLRGSKEPELAAQIEALFEPSRLEEYRLATQGGGQALARFMTRFDLPMSTGRNVIIIQRDVQQKAATIRADTSLDGVSRQTRLGALYEPARSALEGILGSEILSAYRATDGRWLDTYAAAAGAQ